VWGPGSASEVNGLTAIAPESVRAEPLFLVAVQAEPRNLQIHPHSMFAMPNARAQRWGNEPRGQQCGAIEAARLIAR